VSAPNETVLPPGTRLAHYEVRREIGGGAMGTVYEAWDTALDRSVAVKVLRERIAHDPAVVERFFREARAAARVNHPNLTHIYFVGREGERPFFAMEYVPGDTIEQLVADRGALPLGEVVDLLVQAARGLAAAHAGGVIHRDVKPSNLIRRADGVMKVADFGLAKSMDADVNATGGGSLMGTPTFMSPEQCRGREVDLRCDVYALGLVAWYAFAGRAPYSAKSLGELLNDQINTPLPSVVREHPELPPAVDDVLSKLCAKDPADRPATMDEVIRLLETLRPRRLALAPLFARGGAHFVDALAAVLAAAVVALLLMGIGALIQSSPIPVPRWLGRFVAPTILAILATSAGVAALVLPEVWHQTSIGKFLFELRVVRADGTRPGAVCTTIRFLLRYPFFVLLPFSAVEQIGGWAFGIGAMLQVVATVAAIVCYVARDGLTLSDLVTRTRVAYRRRFA
jgi:uncharacterized RDD family membrane protein YckC